MKASQSLVAFAFCFLITLGLCAQTKSLTAAEAKDHIGDRATMCGKVVSAHYAKLLKGEPTFLNLDEPYPHELFTTLIWGSDREKFGVPEDEHKGLRVCVTGKITSYRGRPEIVATAREQIEIQK